MIRSIHNKLLGRLLWLANKWAQSREFYALKAELLRRHGRPDGYVYQKLIDWCWDCDGNGEIHVSSDYDICDRCGGDGIWGTRWILHERWLLGDRDFLILRGRVLPPMRFIGEDRILRGLVDRRSVSMKASHEAELWLFMVYRPSELPRMLRRQRTCGWRLYPLLFIQAVVFEIWMRKPEQCVECRRLTWRIRNWRRAPPRCRSCERAIGLDDLLF